MEYLVQNIWESENIDATELRQGANALWLGQLRWWSKRAKMGDPLAPSLALNAGSKTLKLPFPTTQSKQNFLQPSVKRHCHYQGEPALLSFIVWQSVFQHWHLRMFFSSTFSCICLLLCQLRHSTNPMI